MKCPDCGIEMMIKKTRYVFENDDTPEKETKCFVEQDMVCRNKECVNYQQIVDVVRHPVN